MFESRITIDEEECGHSNYNWMNVQYITVNINKSIINYNYLFTKWN